ncbi:hypothetical protein TSUD_195770 [Trifolium subterraneum]|nr:hypothetical protein TSUD_195770 [Trifolium subterraneum]
MMLQILEMHGLVANRKKCQFAQLSVEYLGHLISGAGAFLWIQANLTWYYLKFIKDYGKIAKSLTELTKKEGFQWNSTAQQAFESLKQKFIPAPVLSLLGF